MFTTGESSKPAIACALSFGLIAAAFWGAVPASAAPPNPVSSVSDPLTLRAYPDVSIPGTIWTDKSVFTGSLGAVDGVAPGSAGLTLAPDELGVALSALGSTRQVVSEKQVPVDLVLILDNSRSMAQCVGGTAYCDGPTTYQNSRAYAMVTAVETALEIIADANPDNRVALVQFGTGAGIIQALGKPTLIPGTADYITLTPPTSNGGAMYLKTAATTVQIGTINSTVQSTNMQLGLITGMMQLATQPPASVTGASQRTPNVIMFTDGEPTLSATTATWWDVPTNAGTQGPSVPGDPQYYGNGFKAALAAAYLKARIADVYNDKAYQQANGLPPVTPHVYTVGLGIQALSPQGRDLAIATLDPVSQLGQTSNIMNSGFTSAWATYSGGGSVSVPVASGTSFTIAHPTGAAAVYDPTSLKYDDAAFTPQTMTDLNAAFRTISQQIVAATPNYPVQIEDGKDESASGFVTFTDPVGAFMRVSDVTYLTFCSGQSGAACSAQAFANPAVTTLAGGVTRYTFSGTYTANDLAGPQNVGSIIITVQRFASLARGDVVTVQIPAALLPMTSQDVTLSPSGSPTGITLTDSEPLHVYYKVAPKTGVVDALGNPLALNAAHPGDGTALRDYMAAHTVGGQVRFYSNSFTGSGAAIAAGTTATFVPASGNEFYRFAADTPLFADSGLTQPLTPALWAALASSGTVWYGLAKYAVSGGVPTRTTVAVDTTKAQLVAGQDGAQQVAAVGTQMVAPAGMLALARADDLDAPKSSNPTATARDVKVSGMAGGVVTSALGNNGFLAYTEPGRLIITETVQAAAALNPDLTTPFVFQVALTQGGAAAVGSYPYDIFDASDMTTPVRSGTVSNGQQVTLTHGQVAVVHGLPAGTEYSVAQVGTPSAYPLTQPAGGAATGTVAAGAEAQADFVNTYRVSPVAVPLPPMTATLTGRAWTGADTFTAEVCAQGGAATDCVTAPFVQTGATGTGPAAFPGLTFDAPGTYVYTIAEVGDNPPPGVSMSAAQYRWTVTVTDTGNGTLTVNTKLERLVKDAGTPETPAVTVTSADFLNVFSATSVHEPLTATKLVIDKSLGASTAAQATVPTRAYPFTFAYVGSLAPLAPTVTVPSFSGASSANVQSFGAEIVSPAVTFDTSMVGQTFIFKLSEDAPAAGSGVTASDVVWFYRVEVGLSGGDIDPAITTCHTTVAAVAAASPYGDCDPTAATDPYAATTQAQRKFVNTYDPAPATAKLKATETLGGRPWLLAETFTLTLTGKDAATQAAIHAGIITLVTGTSCSDTMATAVGSAGNTCYDIAISQQGTYQLALTQTGHAGPTSGMTYDTETAVFEVVVTDDGAGALHAAVTLEGAAAGDVTAHFVNRYEAAYLFSGLDVTKALTGRDPLPGEFSFTLTALDQASCVKAGLTSPACAVTVTNGGPTADLAVLPVEFDFTQADLTKAYHYSVTEANTAAGGVTYDTAVRTVDVAPQVDAITGEMYVKTTVTGPSGARVFDSRTQIAAVGFANSYAAAPATVTPEFSLVLHGRAWTPTDSFGFAIHAVTPGAPVPGVTDVSVTAAGGFDFGPVTWTAPGTYQYAVAQKMPATPLGGLEYDEMTSLVTVVVTDDGHGQLVAHIVYDGNQDFANYYHAVVDWGINQSVTLKGRAMAPAEFSFLVTPLDALSAEAAGIPLTGIDWANPSAAPSGVAELMSGFPVLHLTQDQAGETLCYEFAAVVPTPGAPNVQYDDTTYEVCAAVTDLGDGKLQVTAIMTDSEGNTKICVTCSGDIIENRPVLPFVLVYSAAAPKGVPAGGSPASGSLWPFALSGLMVCGGMVALTRRRVTADGLEPSTSTEPLWR